jgi:hypothetical protein
VFHLLSPQGSTVFTRIIVSPGCIVWAIGASNGMWRSEKCKQLSERFIWAPDTRHEKSPGAVHAAEA